MEGLTENVKILKEWIADQPHLPSRNTDALLTKFLLTSNYSVEVSKHLIELFYIMRSKNPDIFTERDLYHPEVQDSIEIIDMVKLPRNVGNNRIVIMRLNSCDLGKFHFLSAAKMFTIFDDILSAIDETVYEGDIVLMDMYKVTLRHLPKCSLSIARKMIEYIQEARPTNLKQIHCLNVPAFIGIILIVFKPFIKKEILDIMKFHLPKSTTLHEFVSTEYLPEEYGGSCGKIEDFKHELLEIVIKNQSIILDESYWKVDESKRNGQSSCQETYGVQGSIKKLDIN